MTRFLFASDLHGDLGKYRALVNHCNSQEIDALLIGGDLVDGDVNVEGQEKKVSQHAAFINESLEEVLSEEEREVMGKVQNEEQRQHVMARAFKKYRTAIKKGFRKRVEEKELSLIKKILAEYPGPKVVSSGNHDPNFVREYLGNEAKYVDDCIVTIKGVKIAGGCASYEPSAAALHFPEFFPHTQNYNSTRDEKISQEDFSRADGHEPAQIYLWHRGVTDRFSPDRADAGNTHDYHARRLVEIARAKGEDPLVLSGHFHSLDGGREKGVTQLRAGPDYVYEFVYDPGRKRLTEIIVYKYAGEQEVARKAA